MRKRKKREKNAKTVVSCVKCPNCQDIIYSRTRHDFHFCRCGNAFVDGGQDYFRYGYPPDSLKPRVFTKTINVSKKALYDDWNTGTDDYGIL